MPYFAYKILQISSTISLHFTLTEVCKGVLSRKQDLMPKKASPSVALSNCMAERDKSSLWDICGTNFGMWHGCGD